MSERTVRDPSTGETTRVFRGPVPPPNRQSTLRVGSRMSEQMLSCREAFPKQDGKIVDPRRLPNHLRGPYGKAILEWLRTTTFPREAWPEFLPDLIDERERRKRS